MTNNHTIVFHIPEKKTQSSEQFESTLNSIISQNENSGNYIGLLSENSLEIPAPFINQLSLIDYHESFSIQFNSVLKNIKTSHILYIHNQHAPVLLKRSACDLFALAHKRNPGAGMIYADYELINDEGISEIHLLNHHAGRIRDNQDYGFVFSFSTSVLRDISGFNQNVRHNHLYDLRLRISEKAKIIHLSNRYSGSLYTVNDNKNEANVFDYLMAGKDVQLEAENILTQHLKRVNAYLPPGAGFKSRSTSEHEKPLTASVIIPVNNRPEFIGTAIESVFKQTVQDIEVIIVVNGGEKDPTIPVVRQYQKNGERYQPHKPEVRLVILDINNIGFCLNAGAEIAKGKYYVQLDSDDRLKPDAVEKIDALFQSDPKIGMVIGSYEVWEKLDSGKIVRVEEIPVVTHDEWTDDNGRNNLLRINGAGAPRSIPINLIRESGYFGINDDPFARNYGEDYDMVLHISEHYKIGRIYTPIYEVIRHSGGTDHNIDQSTIDRNDEAKDWMRLKAIKRRQEINR